jgi:hypothetical protein
MAAERLLWDKKNARASEGSNAGKFDTQTVAIASHREIFRPNITCDGLRQRCRFKRVWIFLSTS